MADNPQTLASITSALAQTFANEIKQQINYMSVLLAISKIVKGSGKNVAWTVEADGAIAETFAEGASVSNFGSNAIKPATLDWAKLRSNFRVTNTAAAAAESSHSPAEARDLLGRNLMGSMQKLASHINGQIYTGAGGSDEIVGLSTAVDASGIYAGLNRASETYWRAYEVDSSNASLTLGQIRTDLSTIYESSGFRPDIALCRSATRDKVKALFDPSRQWGRDVMTARGRVTLENSADVVVVDGCQFIEDKDAPANAIYYLNSREYEIEVLPQVSSFANPLAPVSDGFNTLMAGFHAYELGRVGSDRRMSIEAHLQLKVLKPNAFGKRLNVG